MKVTVTDRHGEVKAHPETTQVLRTDSCSESSLAAMAVHAAGPWLCDPAFRTGVPMWADSIHKFFHLYAIQTNP